MAPETIFAIGFTVVYLAVCIVALRRVRRNKQQRPANKWWT